MVASNNAAETNPDWYENLVADPKVTVEVGGDSFEGVAATATGAARQEVIDAVVERLPFIPATRSRWSGRSPSSCSSGA